MSQPEMTPEERRQRGLRAAELIEGAGWVFDEYVKVQQGKIINSAPDDMTTRETAYTLARAALEMKAALAKIANSAIGDKVLHDHKHPNE